MVAPSYLNWIHLWFNLKLTLIFSPLLWQVFWESSQHYSRNWGFNVELTTCLCILLNCLFALLPTATNKLDIFILCSLPVLVLGKMHLRQLFGKSFSSGNFLRLTLNLDFKVPEWSLRLKPTRKKLLKTQNI